jgi:hypothetical protein
VPPQSFRWVGPVAVDTGGDGGGTVGGEDLLDRDVVAPVVAEVVGVGDVRSRPGHRVEPDVGLVGGRHAPAVIVGIRHAVSDAVDLELCLRREIDQ